MNRPLQNSAIGDPETKRPILAVPLPDNLSAERIEKAVGGLLEALSRGG